MPGQKTAKLPNSFIIAGITHISIGGGYLFLSTVIAQHLTYNTYMGLLLGLIFFLPFIFISADFARIFPNQSFTVIYRQVLGKYCGTFLSLFFIAHVILTSALGLKQSLLMISSYFFLSTPQILITIIFVAIILYLALHGIKAISRLAGFMLIPPLAIIFILQFLGLSQVDWTYVRPILTGAPFQWLATGFDSLYLFIAATAGIFYLPFIKASKEMLKVTLIPLGICFPLFFLATIGIIGTFGPTVITKMAWPSVEFFHVIDVPFLLLEQAGLFFLITWLAFLYVAETLGIYLTSHELNFIWPKMKLNWLIMVVAVIILIIAGLPMDIVTMVNFTNRYYWVFIFMNYTPFLIAWMVARVRFQKK